MASLGSLIEQAGSDFNFEGMEYLDFRDNAQAGGRNEDEERPPSSYADAAANGGNRGGHRPPRPPPVAAPTPTHVSRVPTVLIDVKAIKPSHDRADRAALIINDIRILAVTVTAI